MQLTLQQAMEMAMTHVQQGRLTAGISMLRQILTIQPDHPGVLTSLGMALFSAGQVGESLSTFEQITKLHPAWPDGWTNLSVVLHRVNRLGEAEAALRKSIELGGENATALNNLGGVLQDMGRWSEAADLHRRSIAMQPQTPASHSNLGNALRFSGQLDDAIASFRRAIELSPDDPTFHHFVGLTLLLRGDFQEGWAEHEWRCRIKGPQQYCADFPQPRWNGEELNGRRILIHAEQGFGDTIQFARYLSLVRQRGGTILFRCQPELVRLFNRFPDIEQTIAETAAPPPFEVHCPLMSLPFVFGTTLETIPSPRRYVNPDPTIVQQWRDRLASSDGYKIGLAWTGKRTYSDDRNRSMPLSALAPLAQIGGVRWISLQKESNSANSQGFTVADFSSNLTDFAETAGLIENLDLVISVDTAVAHLAAAMGKAVWLLLPYVPDWRWLMHRTDSPWYPTVRLFRQSDPGDWGPPVQQVVQELSKGAPNPSSG